MWLKLDKNVTKTLKQEENLTLDSCDKKTGEEITDIFYKKRQFENNDSYKKKKNTGLTVGVFTGVDSEGRAGRAEGSAGGQGLVLDRGGESHGGARGHGHVLVLDRRGESHAGQLGKIVPGWDVSIRGVDLPAGQAGEGLERVHRAGVEDRLTGGRGSLLMRQPSLTASLTRDQNGSNKSNYSKPNNYSTVKIDEPMGEERTASTAGQGT